MRERNEYTRTIVLNPMTIRRGHINVGILLKDFMTVILEAMHLNSKRREIKCELIPVTLEPVAIRYWALIWI